MSLARACVTRAASKNPALLLLLCLPIATDVRTRVPFGPQRSPSLTTPTPTGRGVITHPRKPILHRIHPPNPAINPTQKTPILFISPQILFILFKTPPPPLPSHRHGYPHPCPLRPRSSPLTTPNPCQQGGTHTEPPKPHPPFPPPIKICILSILQILLILSKIPIPTNPNPIPISSSSQHHPQERVLFFLTPFSIAITPPIASKPPLQKTHACHSPKPSINKRLHRIAFPVHHRKQPKSCPLPRHPHHFDVPFPLARFPRPSDHQKTP
jgi:hypothetical protein